MRWTTSPRPASSGAPFARRRMRAEAAFHARAIARAARATWASAVSGHGAPASAS